MSSSREMNQADLEEKRLQAQKKQGVNWQKPSDNWKKAWAKDKEFRKLFNNNYRHMRSIASKKGFAKDQIRELKRNELEQQEKRNKLEF